MRSFKTGHVLHTPCEDRDVWQAASLSAEALEIESHLGYVEAVSDESA